MEHILCKHLVGITVYFRTPIRRSELYRIVIGDLNLHAPHVSFDTICKSWRTHDVEDRSDESQGNHQQ